MIKQAQVTHNQAKLQLNNINQTHMKQILADLY